VLKGAMPQAAVAEPEEPARGQFGSH